MMRRKWRKYSPELKAKEAIAAVTGDKALAGPAQLSMLTRTVLQVRKRSFRAPADVFGGKPARGASLTSGHGGQSWPTDAGKRPLTKAFAKMGMLSVRG